MTMDESEKLFEVVIQEMRDLLFQKGREYSGPVDRLANFKSGAELGLTPEQKLLVYFDKHKCSVYTYVKEGGKTYSNERIEGRIADAMNYLFLLRCLIHERKQFIGSTDK